MIGYGLRNRLGAVRSCSVSATFGDNHPVYSPVAPAVDCPVIRYAQQPGRGEFAVDCTRQPPMDGPLAKHVRTRRKQTSGRW
jgi:hypothetical protein